jgi:threonine dehydrogenase-like Zn-dependent dehydrogenase
MARCTTWQHGTYIVPSSLAAVSLGLAKPVVAHRVFGQPNRFDIDQVVYKQIAVVGAVGSHNYWAEAIELLDRCRVELAPVVAEIVPLDALGKPFGVLESAVAPIKIVVQP